MFIMELMYFTVFAVLPTSIFKYRAKYFPQNFPLREPKKITFVYQ
jgi:hypothetical protein